MLKKLIQALSIDRNGAFLIILGSISWCLTMVKSGFVYPFGMGFWGPNGHDGIWHISLANSLARGSWDIPVFAGESLMNYHVGFDLILAIVHKLTLIPIHTLYFQIMPPIMALLVGLFVYKFVYSWKKSTSSAFWATFFVYFGGSWGWVVTLFREGKLGGESLFWSQQSVSTLINPPFTFSLILLFAGLWALMVGIRNSDNKLLAVATFLFGVLVQIKVYAGILVLGSLFIAGVRRVVKRKGVDVLKVFVGALVVSILIFSPHTNNTQDSIVFLPFWFLETMMGLSDRFYWSRFYEAMVNYRLGNVWFKAIPAYLIAFGIFLIGNFGTRLVGLFWLVKKGVRIKSYQYIDVLIVSVIVAGIAAPMLFLQTGTPWNTIQFFYFSLVFSGVLAGIALGDFLEKSKLSSMVIRIIIVVIVSLTIPTTVGTLWYHYLPGRPPAKISKAELEALNFLKNQPDGVVLAYPYDAVKAKEAEINPPRSLYLYESTAYVSALSHKGVFLEDQVNLDITNYPWRERREEVLKFYASLRVDEVRKFLSDNNLQYIYWVNNQRALLGEDQLGIEKIFENEEVDIYRVN